MDPASETWELSTGIGTVQQRDAPSKNREGPKIPMQNVGSCVGVRKARARMMAKQWLMDGPRGRVAVVGPGNPRRELLVEMFVLGATALGKLERERKEMTERREHGTGAAEARRRWRGGGEGLDRLHFRAGRPGASGSRGNGGGQTARWSRWEEKKSNRHIAIHNRTENYGSYKPGPIAPVATPAPSLGRQATRSYHALTAGNQELSSATKPRASATRVTVSWDPKPVQGVQLLSRVSTHGTKQDAGVETIVKMQARGNP
ncbi:hypothetical protein GGX14DRAFT_395996 [Mycena pura]|uniref:Uncharacterized protein n=1 Tax=Mycena pura TaxID=153505 RepID=A0AAD6YAE4_9AGAR|nr:hypothetical protein GGX14DRAFT_395996 [Mycena pura]